MVSDIVIRVRKEGKMYGGTLHVCALSFRPGPNLTITHIACLSSSVNLPSDPSVLQEVYLPGDSGKKKKNSNITLKKKSLRVAIKINHHGYTGMLHRGGRLFRLQSRFMTWEFMVGNSTRWTLHQDIYCMFPKSTGFSKKPFVTSLNIVSFLSVLDF